MRKLTPWLLMMACVLCGSGTPARAWQAADSPPDSSPAQGASLQEQMADLNRSVQELVALLHQYLGNQQVDLLIKRVELGRQKASPLAQELRELRARRSADAERLAQLRTAQAAQGEQPERTGTSEEEEREAAVRETMLEGELKLLKGRIAQADQRIAELENELMEEERNIRSWEALIDRRLGTP
jgi:septum formation inhibitor MinC